MQDVVEDLPLLVFLQAGQHQNGYQLLQWSLAGCLWMDQQHLLVASCALSVAALLTAPRHLRPDLAQ